MESAHIRPPEYVVEFFGPDLMAKSITLVASHAAWLCLYELSGVSAHDWLVDYLQNLNRVEKTYDLVWALTANYRRHCPLTREQLLDLLPSTNEGWDKLLEILARMLRESFFFRSHLQPVALRMTMQILEEQRAAVGPAVSPLPEASESVETSGSGNTTS